MIITKLIPFVQKNFCLSFLAKDGFIQFYQQLFFDNFDSLRRHNLPFCLNNDCVNPLLVFECQEKNIL